MDNDDLPIGRLLTRREVVALFGAGAVVVAVGCSDSGTDPTPTTSAATDVPANPATSTATRAAATATSTQAPASAAATAAATTTVQCLARPELTEGPYFVDEKLNRSDIRPDPSNGKVSEGTPLALTFNVFEANGSQCAVLKDAQVDVWHCDALGVYSDVRDPGGSTVGQKFLRGYQVTDGSGVAKFLTIYPGWYQGRAVHIHFKIRTGNREFTSQLFFDDSLNDEVYKNAPYSQKGTNGITRNSRDGIFQGSRGQLTLDVKKDGSGYAATFGIAISS